MHDDLEEFYIHIVFQSNAPVNQKGIEFPPPKKYNATDKPKKSKNNS